MLPESEKLSRFSRPLLEAPETIRLRFNKVGSLQYISHLDLQRTFARVLVRAGIPLWYTKGFNPHAKLVFAMPLSVGAESECELLDVRVDREISDEEVRRQLNDCLTEEMMILEAYRPTEKFSGIRWAEYGITIRSAGLSEALCREMETYLTTSPVMVTKKGKAGIREEDIIPSVRKISAELRNGELVIHTVLTAGEGALNPEFLVSVLKARFGILSGDPFREGYRILRKKFLCEDGVTEFR